MPSMFRPYGRLPVQCSVTYYAGILPKLPLAYILGFVSMSGATTLLGGLKGGVSWLTKRSSP